MLPLDKMIASILQDYDLIVALLPLGDLDGFRGRIETGVAGGPALTRTTPRTRARTARAKDLGEQRAMTIGTTKARTLQKARINQDRAKVLEAANRSGCPKASAIREPRPGVKKETRLAMGSTWVLAQMPIARRAITLASFSGAVVTARSVSAL